MASARRIQEYLAFREFLTPFILQLLFWAGIGGTLYGTWWLFVHDYWAWIMSLLFGPLLTRMIFENMMLRYTTFLYIKEIRNTLNNASKDS